MQKLGEGRECITFLYNFLKSVILALVNLIIFWLSIYQKFCFIIQTALRLELMSVLTTCQIYY